MNNNYRLSHAVRAAGALSSLALTAATSAYGSQVADLGHSVLNIDAQAIYGAFHSEKAYATGSASEVQRHRWQEGVLSLGAEIQPKDDGFYGRVSALASATWGDGDAAGFSSGNEREIKLEDAYLGYRNTSLGNSRSPWTLDVSVGRQPITLGDGFLVGGDVINLGDALGESLNRGGASYLARRQAFDQTAVIAVEKQAWKGQLSWFKSDNAFQADTEMAALTLSHDHGSGLLEANYLHGLSVDEDQAVGPQSYLSQRDGMNVYSLRFEQSLMGDALNLRGEYAYQDKESHENAWYLEPAWTFQALPGSPTLSLRYTRYSEEWDPLFFGFPRGYGTWFQGTVAGNYAGPFNSNTEVWQLAATATINDSLSLGAQVYDFNSLDIQHQPDTSGQEFDLYAEWMPAEWLYISPQVGWYDPDKSVTEGGTQWGDDETSFYAQLIVGFFF